MILFCEFQKFPLQAGRAVKRDIVPPAVQRAVSMPDEFHRHLAQAMHRDPGDRKHLDEQVQPVLVRLPGRPQQAKILCAGKGGGGFFARAPVLHDQVMAAAPFQVVV